MTTVIQFEQPPNTAFQFNPTLDGQVYSATVVWSLFGKRYYLRLLALDGTLVFEKALIASPSSAAVESLTWANGYAKATTALPHGYRILDTVDLTVSGCTPEVYNGRVRALITKADQFIWPLAVNPGAGTRFGLVAYNINMAEGYFTESSLVFRETSQQFEVSP